jgi:hypothetical protein
MPAQRSQNKLERVLLHMPRCLCHIPAATMSRLPTHTISACKQVRYARLEGCRPLHFLLALCASGDAGLIDVGGNFNHKIARSVYYQFFKPTSFLEIFVGAAACSGHFLLAGPWAISRSISEPAPIDHRRLLCVRSLSMNQKPTLGEERGKAPCLPRSLLTSFAALPVYEGHGHPGLLYARDDLPDDLAETWIEVTTNIFALAPLHACLTYAGLMTCLCYAELSPVLLLLS